MTFLVDTVRVDPGTTERYLDVIHGSGAPVMEEAGAPLVACWRTAEDLGEQVSVQTIWSFGDHAAWNEIRKNLVLDRRWYRYSSEISELRTGGERRFFYPARFSPLK
jgi:hypothetical protein